MELQEHTKQLKKYLDVLKDQFENSDPPESKKNKQFFLHVKEKTDPVYRLLEEWEESALAIVKERKVNVHPQQITSTRENMELLLLHSFYVDVKRKRYMELNHSIHFIFDQLLSDLKQV
ncbi:DUF1798 family protein [Virgibacillus byunsanensis]